MHYTNPGSASEPVTFFLSINVNFGNATANKKLLIPTLANMFADFTYKAFLAYLLTLLDFFASAEKFLSSLMKLAIFCSSTNSLGSREPFFRNLTPQYFEQSFDTLELGFLSNKTDGFNVYY